MPTSSSTWYKNPILIKKVYTDQTGYAETVLFVYDEQIASLDFFFLPDVNNKTGRVSVYLLYAQSNSDAHGLYYPLGMQCRPCYEER